MVAGREALAQAPPQLPGAVVPGRDRPLPQPPAQPSFEFTIELPGRSEVPRAVEELRFQLNGIRIEGAQNIPPEALQPLYAGLIGKEVSVTNILDIADAIGDAYRQRGYVISHAFVPPQRVRDGIFTINVVEGYVDAVSVEGGSPATQALIRSYFAPVLAERPLRLGTMERALLLANDTSGVAASGVLRPSPNTPGASDLVVSVVESPFAGGINVDNRGSQFQGFWTIGGDVEANGLITGGDQLMLSFATSPNLLEKTTGQVRYRVPIGADGLAASGIVTVTHGEPGASLTPLTVVTDSYAVGPRLSYPLLRSRAESLSLDGGFTAQSAKVTALGISLSHDQWRVLDLSANYSRFLFGGAAAASLNVAEGVGILGATNNDSISNEGLSVLSQSGASHGNPQFTKLSGTLRYAREIYGPLNASLTAQGQYGFAPLVAGEQIAFGGSSIGRGYDPGAITGDHGAGGAFELRYDQRLPEYFIELLQPYVYYDTAKVWNVHGATAGLAITGGGTVGTGSGLALSSAGFGLRVFFPHNITAAVEVSHTMKAVPGSDNGKRTNKILMEASVRF